MLKLEDPIIIDKNNVRIEVFPRKSHLARRILIRISKRKGIELIIPKRASLKSALSFLSTKENWVIQRYLEIGCKKEVKFVEGAQIPMLGNNYIIKYSGTLRGITKIEDNCISISGLPEHIGRKTKQFLIKTAKEEITARAHIEAQKLNVKFAKITIRDTTSRWGSCSFDKSLSFSWRLVLAPSLVMEYVVAHEIAHLIEMNHSDRFWDIVASICPHHKASRKWLKANGEMLHSYAE